MNTKRVKELWETEEIRVLVLASLLIQALLTFLAPRRKNCPKTALQVLLWALYLLADVIAIYIIGLISISSCYHYAESIELLALWASFLLLHLGGPDTITALALEDNELWRRHALQLATQVSITAYVFLSSFQYSNRSWIATVLMFVVGFIKYFERTCTLYYSSRSKLQASLVTDPDPEPKFARIMEEYYSAKHAHIPAGFEYESQEDIEPEEMDRVSKYFDMPPYASKDHVEEAKVQYAFKYYQMYKPLLVEEFLSLEDRQRSRDFFLRKCNSVEAFEIIQIELNLIYDAFYTKSFLLWTKQGLVRLLCFVLVVVSLVLFTLTSDWKKHETDAIITFILFCGAIALDISAFIMFVLSDWWVILTRNEERRFTIESINMGKILRWSRWARRLCHSRRWSQTIYQYNLLQESSIARRPPLLVKCIFKIKYIRDIFIFVKVQKTDEKLMSFIREEIWNKAEQASNLEVAKEVLSARGNLVLEDDYYLASECLSPWTIDVDYDESLITWNLATDICYWTTDSCKSSDRGKLEAKHREISKKLSDYMLYLLMRQQTLLSSLVGTSSKVQRFKDTCAAVQSYVNHKKFHTSSQDNQSSRPDAISESEYLKTFSEHVLKESEVLGFLAKDAKSKAVLFNACCLAKQLQMFGDRQWEITSKVWLEMLCYAAARCSPGYHIAQLSKGGELITFVWLLMAHLGLGERFLRPEKEYGSDFKLIIEK